MGASAPPCGHRQPGLTLFYIRQFACRPAKAGLEVPNNNKFEFNLIDKDVFPTNHIEVFVQNQTRHRFTDHTWHSWFFSLFYTYRFCKNTIARARQRTACVKDEKWSAY